MNITLNFSNLGLLIATITSMTLFCLICISNNKKIDKIYALEKKLRESQSTINNLNVIINEQVEVNQKLYQESMELYTEYASLTKALKREEDKSLEPTDANDSKFTN